ncbi:hypothetical protein [Gluconobacter cerinus]|uniref:hypothetical protein n=1 Tax=Gluconobacter cerinus TaxID=38307 RepID=UPI001B8B71D3|nr:hypothetical protein [Gluconobacter cerinus]MBS1069746.1 hypothetical protein [Gluconobacter cerinus]
MSSQTEMALEQAAPDAGLLSRMFATADRLMVKKLRNNDRDWAHNRSKHQAGVFIPVETRDSGFFPELTVKRRKQAAAAEIREAFFLTVLAGRWAKNAQAILSTIPVRATKPI